MHKESRGFYIICAWFRWHGFSRFHSTKLFAQISEQKTTGVTKLLMYWDLEHANQLEQYELSIYKVRIQFLPPFKGISSCESCDGCFLVCLCGICLRRLHLGMRASVHLRMKYQARILQEMFQKGTTALQCHISVSNFKLLHFFL